MPDFERLILNRDIKRLMHYLSSRRRDYRVRALRGLGEARAVEAIPLLGEMLSDPDSEVRSAAVSALGMLRRRESTDSLIHAMHSSDHRDVVAGAWDALVGLGGAERARLTVHLERFDDHPELLLRILGHLDPAQIPSKLVRLLDHSTERVVAFSRERLRELGDSVSGLLYDLFVTGSPNQAREIAGILRTTASAQVEPLLRLLKRVSGEPERQSALLYVLADTGDERVAIVLKELLRDPNRQVRITALALLTRYRKQAIEAFKDLLREPEFPDRTRLIAYVKQRWRLWGDALIDLLSTTDYSDWRVRELAKMTLGGHADLLPAVIDRYVKQGDLNVEDVADLVLFDRAAWSERLVAWVRPKAEEDSEEGERLWGLLRLAVRREGRDAVQPLVETARDPDCPAPAVAIRLLTELGEDAAPAIVGLLEHRSVQAPAHARRVRALATEAARTLADACGPLLVRAIELPGVTRELEEAVPLVGDAALPPLCDALTRAYRQGRDWKTYCRVLAGMRGEDARPLLPLIEHASGEVRRAAFLALRGREGEALEAKLAEIVNRSLGKRPVEPRVLWSLDVLERLDSPGARSTMQRLVTHPDPRVRRRALDYVRKHIATRPPRDHFRPELRRRVDRPGAPAAFVELVQRAGQRRRPKAPELVRRRRPAPSSTPPPLPDEE